MLNFDVMPDAYSFYDGAAKKRAIQYDNDIYMVKYPAKTDLPNDLNTEYSNSSFSEYVSCHIINALKIPNVTAQETLLGESNGKIVVACKDFTTSDLSLVKFNMIQNADLDSDMSGRHPILQDVLQTYKTLPQLQNPAFIQRFWDTVAVDALLGNFDRHSGNWGFLNDQKNKKLHLAPIYDCGSCLYPSLSESKMRDILSSQEEINKRLFVFPKTAFRDKTTKEKISYADLLGDSSNTQLQQALIKLKNYISFDVIHAVIDSTPYISEIQKEFYNTMIQQRYEKLIEPAIVKNMEQYNPIQAFCEKWAEKQDMNGIAGKNIDIDNNINIEIE